MDQVYGKGLFRISDKERLTNILSVLTQEGILKELILTHYIAKSLRVQLLSFGILGMNGKIRSG
ncbi:hypothetical protein D3C87_1887720 [compost metagenome]